MKLPKPEPGLVFRYDYLWQREAGTGKGTSKERPACLAVASDSLSDPRIVIILPITHSKPNSGTVGIEIPASVRRHLKLDGEKCWVIVSEANVDRWPNPGLGTIPGTESEFVYGLLPPTLFSRVRLAMLQHLDIRRSVRR